MWTLRPRFIYAQALYGGRCARDKWQGEQAGLDALRLRAGESERSQPPERGPWRPGKLAWELEFGLAWRAARVPAAEQLENYLPPSN